MSPRAWRPPARRSTTSRRPRIYVVDWDESKLGDLTAGFGRAAERVGAGKLVPVTLIPVPRLFQEGHLVEIEATAVLE